MEATSPKAGPEVHRGGVSPHCALMISHFIDRKSIGPGRSTKSPKLEEDASLAEVPVNPKNQLPCRRFMHITDTVRRN